MSHALELCFQLRQYDVLHQIADDLSQDTNPEMINRVTNTAPLNQDCYISYIECYIS